MPESRTILHVDMDQFYAAVEIRDDPSLRGRPVIVGSDPKGGKGRGVVSTASYEARKFGVHSAMPISQAWQRCPHGAFLPVQMDKYIAESKKIHQVFESVTPLVEPISLDEAFLDVSSSRLLFGDGPAVAKKVKRDIRDTTGLTASVGVAPNKFLAKIASDLDKPDGLVIVQFGKEAEFLAPLPIRAMWGVGPKAAQRLARLGIRTIGDAAAFPLESLRADLGSYADELKGLALGLDEREVVPEHQAKSIGRESTYREDSSDMDQMRQTLAELSEDVAWRLRRHDLAAGQVTLKIRFTGFETYTRQRAIRPSTNHGPDLYKIGLELTKEMVAAKKKKVRLLGLSAGKLSESGTEAQPDLFSDQNAKAKKVDKVMDQLNEKYGGEVLRRANQMGKAGRRNRTGFSPDSR